LAAPRAVPKRFQPSPKSVGASFNYSSPLGALIFSAACILYDNTRIAVKEITGEGERRPTEAFSGLQSHYLFAAKFGRPGKGNDKGNVEGLVGYARRNFMVPVPRAASWEELNAHLLEQCRKRRERRLWGHHETIQERFKRDQEKLLPLPPVPLEACQQRTTRASSQALVRFETNDYSVPVEYGHRQVLLKAFVWEVVIGCSNEVIARHPRSYGPNRSKVVLQKFCKNKSGS
jgi:hypothetical protein